MTAKNKQRIVAVCGPTASGKTTLAIELAKELGGEIISCDSMQLYRGMDIGTAKPNAEELAEIPHHLINILDPSEEFSCADYKQLAEDAIADIASRGLLPIFCGGTGLYLDAVLTANSFSTCSADDNRREELLSLDSSTLHCMLEEIDPDAALAIHPNNKKRVVRAIEIYRSTGITKTEWDRRSRECECPYDATVIMPDYDREILYRRIDARVDAMIANGLIEEAHGLILPQSSTAAQAIGYKELTVYFEGSRTLAQVTDDIKTATRNYAKRQLTWFRHRPYVKVLHIDENEDLKHIVNNALKLLT